MSKDKTVSIRILSGCRVSGKSLEAGKVYKGLAYEDAKFAVSAGRAVYETAAAVPPKKPTTKKEGDE